MALALCILGKSLTYVTNKGKMLKNYTTNTKVKNITFKVKSNRKGLLSRSTS